MSKTHATSTRRLSCLTAILLLVLLRGPDAFAGSVLDMIRNYDLNDYALGVAISASQNPYSGAGTSRFAYPYLTSFRHPAFTDDWLLIRGGDLGVRYVTDRGWELGLIGRVQTMGLGGTELEGLSPRGWAFEMGPLVGWRGRWFQAQLRSYWPVPGRHPGSTSDLEVSLPFEFSRGYFVPSATLSYKSSSYSRYYYGVSENEVVPGRPAYDPGATLNYKFGFTLGYDLASKWLLMTTIGLEQLDTAISGSPIVDKERLWSANVGLAYNADIFQPKEIRGEARAGTVTLRAAAFHSTIKTDVRRDTASGAQGTVLEFEDLIGSSSGATVLQVEAIARPGYYHRIKTGYFQIDRELQAVLQQDLPFGDEIFRAGTRVTSSLNTRRLGILYGYSLMRDSQKELGVQGGLMFTRIDLSIVAEETGQAEAASIDAPLPTIGAYGSVALGRSMELGLEVGIFALDFDRYSGYSGQASLTLERQMNEALSLGVGYEYYFTRIESEDDELRGLLRTRNAGARAYLSWTF